MRYKALRRNGEIDAEVALLQGIQALDAACEVAEKTNDVEGLLNGTAMWMKLSETIQGFAEKAAEEARPEGIVKTTEPKIEIGFQCAKPDTEPIIAEEDEVNE